MIQYQSGRRNLHTIFHETSSSSKEKKNPSNIRSESKTYGARTSMSIRSNHHGIGHPSHHEIENTMIVLCCDANEYCIRVMILDPPATLRLFLTL
mmetsp:Transcript_482/g.456  ORF Transcript_482/g.456 Transcript_482/m.456 type:complete len:95 (-) Transcript_482:70-354(-)